MGTTEGEEREKGTGEISETIAENFLQINLSHQTTESRSSEIRSSAVSSLLISLSKVFFIYVTILVISSISIWFFL